MPIQPKNNDKSQVVPVSKPKHPKRMNDQVYKHIEITGTSTKSIEGAVSIALKRASKTIENLSWFQIIETRGSIKKNEVNLWQVTIKVGFSVD